MKYLQAKSSLGLIRIFFHVIILLIIFQCFCHRQYHHFLIEAESFKHKGGWVVDPQFVEQMGSPYLLAHGLGKPVDNAKTEMDVPASGKYHVWARTKNWVPGNWQPPGKFKLSVNGHELSNTLGH